MFSSHRYISRGKNAFDKRRGGGVAIIQSETCISTLTAVTNVDTLSRNSIVRDICIVDCTLKNNTTLVIVSVYIRPNQCLQDIINFLSRSLLSYSPAIQHAIRFQTQDLSQLPMIVCGDFNVNFKLPEADELITFLNNDFNLEMITNRFLSTTQHNTCIDAKFGRYVNICDTELYSSSFSYHKAIFVKM